MLLSSGVRLSQFIQDLFPDKFYVNSARNVTVRFPADSAAAYGAVPIDTTIQNWGNAFRGMGWDGTVYLDGEVNGNVNLTYVLTDG